MQPALAWQPPVLAVVLRGKKAGLPCQQQVARLGVKTRARLELLALPPLGAS